MLLKPKELWAAMRDEHVSMNQLSDMLAGTHRMSCQLLTGALSSS